MIEYAGLTQNKTTESIVIVMKEYVTQYNSVAIPVFLVVFLNNNGCLYGTEK